MRRDGSKARAIVDARLEHDEALAPRVDSAMREYAEIHRFVRSLGDDDLHAAGVQNRGAPEKSSDAGVHRAGDGEFAIGDDAHKARDLERLTAKLDRG